MSSIAATPATSELSTDAPHDDTPSVFAPGARVAVLLPLPVDGAYDYVIPEGEPMPAGSIVEVPLGRRFEIGVIWGEGKGDIDAKKIKPIVHRIPLPPLPDVSRRFIDWVAAYTLQQPGIVLRMTLNPARRWKPPEPVTVIQASGASLTALGLALTPARGKVLAAVSGGKTFDTAAQLARAAGVSGGVIEDLIDKGVLKTIPISPASPYALPGPVKKGPVLEPGQAAAARELVAKVGQGFSVTLLDGVTGSGKTEVYLDAVAAALNTGGQALVLLPEIALTSQWLDRFVRRFGFTPA
ncbi:MAG: DEAD/DEAH box helicase family protein, partial [Rhodobacteraceae bacterium]|nr:DEAD/DEAH box helicase family protein [Paracoccaceae bacterium]